MPPNLDNFFQISEQFTESTLVKPDSLFELKFGLSSDVSYYNRQIYTGLDLLGDIGGLYDALKSFGVIFIIAYDFIFGSVFEQHLLSKVFLMDQSKSGAKKENKYERTALNDLKKMKPFKIAQRIFRCQQTKQERKMIEYGLERLNNEMEIDKFIKLQMKIRIALRVLFTKTENFLIRHNRDFVLSPTKSYRTK